MQELIERFQLSSHPEGGYYRQIYQSAQQVVSPVHGNERAALTHIYFLLIRGQVSRFHKVLHDEVWNFYAGAPLRLIDIQDDHLQDVKLGEESREFCHVIPADHWQAAESTGDYSLVGCSVAPGFDFADFSFIEDQQLADQVRTRWPHLDKFI